MATINFNATFNYATKKLAFLDTTDWVTEGIPTADVNGNFQVITPNGLTYYDNTNFTIITGTATAATSNSITLTGTSSTDNFYKNYYVKITSGLGAGQAKKITSYNGTTKLAQIDGTWTTTPDNTSDYQLVLSDIYIDANLNNQDPVVVPLTSNGLPYNGNYEIIYTVYNHVTLEYYTLSKTFEICYTAPTVQITQTVDCLSPLFTSIDDTEYIVDNITPTISRTHTVYYPAASPLVGTAATIMTGVFYTGVQSTTIFSQLTYNLTNGIFIYDEVEGSKTINVECDARLCDIFCCVITLYNKMNKYKGKNDTLYNEYLIDFTQVMSLVTLAREAWNCGKDEKINTILQDILDIADCEPGCGCSDGNPQQIIGLGSTVAFSEVQSNDPNIIVTTSVVGNVTTYYLTLDPVWVSNVNNLYNTNITTATPSYLDLTSTGTNPKTFNIDFLPDTDWVNGEELCFKVLVDYSDYLGNFLTVENVEIQPATGSNFVSPTVASNAAPVNGSSFFNVGSLFTFSSFMTSGNDNYKVFVTAEPVSFNVEGTTIQNPGMLNKIQQPLIPIVNYVQSNSFEVGLYAGNFDGLLLNGSLRKMGFKFYIHVLIKK
jgi:hypothetical protein